MADQGFIPDDQFVPDAKPSGITPTGFIPDEQFQSDEDKYSTYPQMAKTFVEHALGAATFGGSTKAEVATHLAKPEDIEKRTETNPGTSIFGDITGIGGSLAIPGLGEAKAIQGSVDAVKGAQGVLDAARAAHSVEPTIETANSVINAQKTLNATKSGLETAKNTLRAGDVLNPVQATSKIGKNVSNAAKGLLGVSDEVGSGASKVLNYAKSIGATALGSGVEGAIYNGLGGSITEDALGQDKNLNGEQLFSHIMQNAGTGWLVGAGLGGALHLTGVAIPESVGAIRDGVSGLKDAVLGTGKGDAGLVGAMLPDGESSLGKFKAALQNRTTNLNPDDLQGVAKDISGNLQRIDNNVKTSFKDVYGSIDSEASRSKINQLDQGPILDSVQKHINSLDLVAKEMRANPEEFNQGVASRIEKVRNSLMDVATKPEIEIKRPSYSDLNEQMLSTPEQKSLKKQMQDEEIKKSQIIDNAKLVDALRDAKKSLQNIPYQNDVGRSSFKVTGLSQAINSDIKSPTIVGDVAARLASADDVYATGKKFFSPSLDPEFEIKRKDFVKAFFSKGKGKGAYIWDPSKMAKTLGASDSIAKNNALDVLEEYYDYQRKIPQHLEDFVQNVPNDHMSASDLRDIIEKSQTKTSDAFEKYSNEAKKANKTGVLDNLAAFGLATGHPIIGAASEALDFGLNPISKVQKLANLESKLNEITNQVGKGLKGIFNTSTKVLKPLVGIASEYSDSEIKDHQDEAKKFLSMNNNLQEMTDKLYNNTKDINDTAPGTTTALQQAGARAIQFLSSKLPTPSNQNPLDVKYQPSNTEMAKFERYKEIVENPIKALDQVKHGILTPETIETLSAVYPKMYEQMKQAMLMEANQFSKNGTNPIPYSRRLSISMFIGQPISSAYNPQFIMQNQASFMAPQQNQQPQPGQAKSSKAGMEKMKLAGRFSRSLDDNET